MRPAGVFLFDKPAFMLYTISWESFISLPMSRQRVDIGEVFLPFAFEYEKPSF